MHRLGGSRVLKLLIIEPRAHGHHFALYLRQVLDEAARRGWSVTLLTTRDALEHPAAGSLAGRLGDADVVALMPRPRQWMAWHLPALVLNQWLYLRACRQGWCRLSRHDFDALLMLDLDSADRWLAICGSPFGKVPLAGLLVHVKAHRLEATGWQGALARWSLRRLLARNWLRALGVIDPALDRWRTSLPEGEAGKLRLLREPAIASPDTGRAQARARLGIDAMSFVVLVYGALSPRKGIHYLLETLRVHADYPMFVLVAGQADLAVTRLLAEPLAVEQACSGRLHCDLRFASVEREALLFAAADALWLGYTPEFDGQSALLPQAAAHGLPVLASSHGPIAGQVREHGLGVLLRPEVPDEVRAAIESLRADGARIEAIRKSAGEFARRRDVAGFAGALCDALAGA